MKQSKKEDKLEKYFGFSGILDITRTYSAS